MPGRNEAPIVLLSRALPARVIAPMVLQILLLAGGMVMAAVFAGIALDARLGTRPWLTLLLSFVSLPGSLLVTWWLAQRAIARARAALEETNRRLDEQDAHRAAAPAAVGKRLVDDGGWI